MAKNLKVSVAHALGTTGAIERVNFGLTQIQSTFGNVAHIEQSTWDGNTLSWTLRVAGAHLAGTTTVAADSAVVETELPLVLSPFTGRAEGLIQKYGAMLLAPPPQAEVQKTEQERAAELEQREKRAQELRDQMRQSAIAMAQAAGRQWSLLTRQERIAFKAKASEELRSKA